MPMIFHSAIIISAMSLMILLIVAKGDKQFVHLLEGKLFKRNVDTHVASIIYKKHKRFSSVLFFAFGGGAIGLSVILLADKREYFLISAVISAGLIFVGIWGRITSFRAADRELDEVGNVHREDESGKGAKAR